MEGLLLLPVQSEQREENAGIPVPALFQSELLAHGIVLLVLMWVFPL